MPECIAKWHCLLAGQSIQMLATLPEELQMEIISLLDRTDRAHLSFLSHSFGKLVKGSWSCVNIHICNGDWKVMHRALDCHSQHSQQALRDLRIVWDPFETEHSVLPFPTSGQSLLYLSYVFNLKYAHENIHFFGLTLGSSWVTTDTDNVFSKLKFCNSFVVDYSLRHT